MKAPTIHRGWAFAFRLLLGGVFIWAGLSKASNPADFLLAIYAFETGLPEPVLRSIVVMLPWIEVLAGLSIVSGVWQETGLIASALSLAAFLVVTGQAWMRGLEVSCGCFGTALEGESFLGTVQFAFLRNFLLLAIACVLAADFATRRRQAGNSGI